MSDVILDALRGSCKDENCGNFGCQQRSAAIKEVLRLRQENAALNLRLERDAVTYATIQRGMNSQAELIDGLKRRVRKLENLLLKIAGAEAVSSDDEEGCKRPFPGKESRAVGNGPGPSRTGSDSGPGGFPVDGFGRGRDGPRTVKGVPGRNRNGGAGRTR